MVNIRRAATAGFATLALAAGTLAVAPATAAYANTPSPTPNPNCRSPYTLRAGGVSVNLTPCVYRYVDSYDRWEVDGWAHAENASTDIYVIATMGVTTCYSNGCNPVQWYGDTWQHIGQSGTANTPSYVTGINCWLVKASIYESSVGHVGDVESPLDCFH